MLARRSVSIERSCDAIGIDLSLTHLSVCVLVTLYVCLCPENVLWQNCGMDPDAVWGGDEWGHQGMGVLDGVVIVKGRSSFGVNLGHPIVTNGDILS